MTRPVMFCKCGRYHLLDAHDVIGSESEGFGHSRKHCSDEANPHGSNLAAQADANHERSLSPDSPQAFDSKGDAMTAHPQATPAHTLTVTPDEVLRAHDKARAARAVSKAALDAAAPALLAALETLLATEEPQPFDGVLIARKERALEAARAAIAAARGGAR